MGGSGLEISIRTHAVDLLQLAYGGRVSWDVARDEALDLKVPDQQDRRRGLDAMVFPPTEG